MKSVLLILALCLAVGCQSPGTGQAIQTGMIDLTNAHVSQVLDIYGKLTGLKLIEDAQTQAILCCSNHIVLKTTKPVTKSEAMKLLEKVLREQAGAVITPLDDQSASVTYNPALIIVKPKAATEK